MSFDVAGGETPAPSPPSSFCAGAGGESCKSRLPTYHCERSRPSKCPTAAPTARDTSIVLADAGNACPAGYSHIGSVEHCRVALDIYGTDGEELNGVEDASNWPKGCYSCDDVGGCTDGVWFNTHATGAANGGARPYCVSDAAGFATGPDYFFVGDSDVDYWRTTRADFLGSYNIGYGGYTCADVLGEADAYISAIAPAKWVVLYCGENQLSESSDSVAPTFADLQSIIDKYTANGARVLYLGTKPEPGTTTLHTSYESYDALARQRAIDLAEAAAGAFDDPPMVMLDLYNSFMDLGNSGSLYDSDELHMSAEGYGHVTAWAQQAMADTACVVWRNGACSS